MKKISNLAWIDLEMTGLDVQTDSIVEIASMVTDKDLNIIKEGPSFIINVPEDKLLGMSDWVKKTHTKSGLIDKIRASKTTLIEAETETLKFFEEFCFVGTSPLCGNSIWQDKTFLKKYMPKLEKFFHYRIIDVSSIKELIKHWYPENPNTEFKKSSSHRALQDIKESINELAHYRKYFFINT